MTKDDAVPVTAEDERLAHRIVTEWRPNGWPAKEKELARLLARHRGSTAVVEPWPGCFADLQRRRVTTLANLGLMLSKMAGGEAAEVVGYDAADLYAEVLMALAIEDADDTDIALEIARDHPGDDCLASLSQTPATPMDELQRLGQEYDGGSLGRFGHHPEPAIDFEYEVEQIESIISDLEKGMRQGEPVPLDRIERAMTFRVGGDPSAVAAKETLRRLEQRARVLSAPMVQEGFREALADPNVVHVNMLRGGIAKPSIAQIIHIYGEDAIRTALSATPAQEEGVRVHRITRAAAERYMLDIPTLEHFGLLTDSSATPAPPVDETDRLREAMIKRRDSEVAEEKARYAEGRPWKARRYAAQVLTELLGEAK